MDKPSVTTRVGDPSATFAPPETIDTIIVATTMYFIVPIFLMIMAAVVYLRKYPPAQARTPVATAVSALGASIWMSASLVILGHYPVSNWSFLQQCNVILIWINYILGHGLFVGAYNFHLYRFTSFFGSNSPPRATLTQVLGLVLFAPMLSAFLVSADNGVFYDVNAQECFVTSSGHFLALMSGGVLLPGLSVILFTYRLPKTSAGRNFQEKAITKLLAIVYFCSWLTTVLVTLAGGHLAVWGRVLQTSAVWLICLSFVLLRTTPFLWGVVRYGLDGYQKRWAASFDGVDPTVLIAGMAGGDKEATLAAATAHPPSFAAYSGDIPSLVAFSSKDLVETDGRGTTPLMHSISRGHVEAVSWLISQGILDDGDVYARDSSGRTIFHRAANAPSDSVGPIMDVLFTVLASDTTSVLDDLDPEGNPPSCAWAKSHPTATTLPWTAIGANIETAVPQATMMSATNSLGQSCLFFFAGDGRVGLLDATIQQTTLDATQPDATGRTLMHEAAAKGQLEVMTYLHDRHPSISQKRDSESNLPVHDAAKYGQLEAINLLLDWDQSSLNRRNDAGSTPLATVLLELGDPHKTAQEQEALKKVHSHLEAAGGVLVVSFGTKLDLLRTLFVLVVFCVQLISLPLDVGGLSWPTSAEWLVSLAPLALGSFLELDLSPITQIWTVQLAGLIGLYLILGATLPVRSLSRWCAKLGAPVWALLTSILFLPFLRVLLRSVDCIDGRLEVDLNIQCWTNKHTALIPGAIFVGTGISVLVARLARLSGAITGLKIGQSWALDEQPRNPNALHAFQSNHLHRNIQTWFVIGKVILAATSVLFGRYAALNLATNAATVSILLLAQLRSPRFMKKSANLFLVCLLGITLWPNLFGLGGIAGLFGSGNETVFYSGWTISAASTLAIGHYVL